MFTLIPNPTVFPPTPPHPASLFASTAPDASWRAYTKLTFADGSTTVRSASGTSDAPLALHPLIVAPSAHATSITICYATAAASADSSTVVRTFTAPLTPLPGGKRSAYIHPSCAPFVPDTTLGVYVVPTPNPRPTSLPGFVQIEPGGYRAMVALSAITAITPAIQAGGSWDFGRQRFYCFADDGIHSVVVASDAQSISTSKISSAVLISPGAIVRRPDSEYIFLATDLCLYSIAGHRVRRIAHVPSYLAAQHPLGPLTFAPPPSSTSSSVSLSLSPSHIIIHRFPTTDAPPILIHL